MGFLIPGGMRWMPAALAALSITACLQRDYDNPFLSGDSDLEASWREDHDGNGISDSVEFHARDCRGTPAECLRIARDASIAKAQAGLAKGPVDTVKPPADTPTPTKDTVKATLPKDTAIVLPPRDTLIVVPPIDIPLPPVVAVTGIQATEVYLAMDVPKVTPAVTVLPRDAQQQGYSLTSLDESIVKVSGTDLIPVKPGKARVQARSIEGGFTAEFPATVLVPVDTLSSPNLTLTVGAKAVPVIVFQPPDADNKGYVLTSSKPEIARVNGREIVAVKKGNAEITVTSQDGGKTHVFKVKVMAADDDDDDDDDDD